MAAFTTFSRQALERYLVMFDKGQLADYSKITGGIENSNYFVSLDQHGQITDYVLTIVEGLSFQEVPFFSKVVTQLYQYGLPVAAPMTTMDGMSSTIFCGKPTFLVPKLKGTHADAPTPAQCRALGQYLAASHQSLQLLNVVRENPYHAHWMREASAEQLPQLGEANSSIMTDLSNLYASLRDQDLPSGLVHGDLFRDNALFEEDVLTGVIDFYHASADFLAMDIAIVLNDWCLVDHPADTPATSVLAKSVLQGYESVRPLTRQEHEAMGLLQQIAAARFALTRLSSGNPPLKNPEPMIDLMHRLSDSSEC